MFIIAGIYRRYPLNAPKGSQTRPTASRTRESLFNICQSSIEGAHFLDLFAGSGAIGLEALSRGAASATFIESNLDSIHCIKKNIAQLKVESVCKVMKGDVFVLLDHLERKNQTFDVVFADPPYQNSFVSQGMSCSEAVVHWIDTHALLKPKGLLFVEENHFHQPSLENFQTLQKKSTRRLGKAALQCYFRSEE